MQNNFVDSKTQDHNVEVNAKRNSSDECKEDLRP